MPLAKLNGDIRRTSDKVGGVEDFLLTVDKEVFFKFHRRREFRLTLQIIMVYSLKGICTFMTELNQSYLPFRPCSIQALFTFQLILLDPHLPRIPTLTLKIRPKFQILARDGILPNMREQKESQESTEKT